MPVASHTLSGWRKRPKFLLAWSGILDYGTHPNMKAPLFAIIGAALMVVKSPEAAVSGEVRHVRTTAYTPSEGSRGGGRFNAHGARLRPGSAAADWSRFPLGTRFRVRGRDEVFVVDDYGSALVGTNTIDLYMPTRSSMKRWGVRHVDIELIELGSYEKSREILEGRGRSRYVRKMLRELERR